MTDEEKELFSLLGLAWRKFCGLPQGRNEGGHIRAKEDFRELINACQDMIAARVGYRISEKEHKA